MKVIAALSDALIAQQILTHSYIRKVILKFQV